VLGDMTIQRMDNVAFVVDDLDAAVASCADANSGRRPKLELTRYRIPAASGAEPENPPPNV
jgi:hypothetical protein